MMTFRRLAVAATFLAIGVCPSLAGDNAAPQGFFKSNELTPTVTLCGTDFYVPTVFGPTGMSGWIFNDTLVVREVDAGSPADGIVLPNDVIVAVNGHRLGENGGEKILMTFGKQVEPSEISGKMTLSIRRGGKSLTKSLSIRKLGALAEDWPFECAKSKQILNDAAAYLARIQNPDGLFDGRIFVGFGLNGLTWLATEDPKYLENARRLAYGYQKYFDPDETNTVNWGWAYMGVFLAEYYNRTGDDAVLPLCQQIAQSLVKNQQESGTWGHGSFPGQGYVQGGSLNNAGLVCWMALVLIDEIGVKVDQTALRKATNFFSRFPHNGGVPYGDHRPEFGGGNGKNAIPGTVHLILGQQAESEYYARLVTTSFQGRTGGHTGGFMGFIWGLQQGARNPHKPDYRHLVDYWEWLINLSRQWDGGFLVPESIIGKIYTFRGQALSTGGMAMVFAMPNRTLRMHGGPKSVFAKQEKLSDELTEGLELYKTLKFDQLRKTVKPTSDLARQLLAATDRKQADIKLTIERIEKAKLAGNLDLARTMNSNLDLATGGYEPNRGGRNFWISRIEGVDVAKIDRAQIIYESNKWLTYTSAKAKQAFESLANDPAAGVYRRLARKELATPPHASFWSFYCELMLKEYTPTWQLDAKAAAGMLRVSQLRGGNWAVIVARRNMHDAGVLTGIMKEWTSLFASWTGGYPGHKPVIAATRGELLEGWNTVDFDDSGWTHGDGPLGGSEALRLRGTGQTMVRIEFNADRVDFKQMLLGIRVGRGNCVVYLNGHPICWSYATQGPRMRQNALVHMELHPDTIEFLRKGKNVLAVRGNMGSSDFALYAATKPPAIGWEPRPADWYPATVMSTPDLTVKTGSRPELTTTCKPGTTGLKFDVPGKRNDGLREMFSIFSPRDPNNPKGSLPTAMPLVELAKYFGHHDSRIRRSAAFAMQEFGPEAMPFILRALGSSDKRVLRAACDAIGGRYPMNGRGTQKNMTPQICDPAVPKLLPLLEHEDFYVREGALMALANCDKLAAQNLDKVAKLANDPEWWVRAAVGHVLNYVNQPETIDFAAQTIKNYLAETSIFGKNRLLEAMVGMAKRGGNVESIVTALVEVAEQPTYFGGKAYGALKSIGENAKSATPFFNKRLAAAKKRLAKAKADNNKAGVKWATKDITQLESILKRFAER